MTVRVVVESPQVLSGVHAEPAFLAVPVMEASEEGLTRYETQLPNPGFDWAKVQVSPTRLSWASPGS